MRNWGLHAALLALSAAPVTRAYSHDRGSFPWATIGHPDHHNSAPGLHNITCQDVVVKSTRHALLARVLPASTTRDPPLVYQALTHVQRRARPLSAIPTKGARGSTKGGPWYWRLLRCGA